MKYSRFLSFSIIFILVITSCIIFPQTLRADASNGYNAQAAIKYASEHWNDGKGLCAEFVSDCVIAGGLDMPVCPMVYYCVPAIVNASGIQPETLKLDEWGLATKELNEGILDAGDVVFHYCNTHPDDIRVMPHIMFCAGYDEEGYAVYYAHNGACNRRRIRLNINTAYLHDANCDMVGKVIHLSGTNSSGLSYSSINFFDFAGDGTTVSDDNIVVKRTGFFADKSPKDISSLSITVSDDAGNVICNTDIPYEAYDEYFKLSVDFKNDLKLNLKKNNYYVYKFAAKIGSSTVSSSSYSVFVTDTNTVCPDDEEELSMDSYLDAVYNYDGAGSIVAHPEDGSIIGLSKSNDAQSKSSFDSTGQSRLRYSNVAGVKKVVFNLDAASIYNGYGMCHSSYIRVKNRIKKTKMFCSANGNDYSSMAVMLAITYVDNSRYTVRINRKVIQV